MKKIIIFGDFIENSTTGIAYMNSLLENSLIEMGYSVCKLYDPRISDYKSERQFKPTETAIAPNGDIYVADGYGLDFIIHYDSIVPEKFRGDRDKRIAYAVLELFKTRDNIENYNKKALYIMIREMTGTKTQYITKVVNEIKKEYVRLYSLYEKNKIVL